MAPATAPLVLLVDDDPGNLKVLSSALAGQSLSIAVALDGEMALAQIVRDPPDLVLLDALMPGIDGFEVCRRLKNDPLTRDIPVIFMTVLDDTKSRVRGLGLGAVDFVSKPVIGEELLARVKTHLALRHAMKELARARDTLEGEVLRRTEELRLAKERLERELEERHRAELAARKAQSELAHLNRVAAMGELAASIAHELTQPLAGIMSNACAAVKLLEDAPKSVDDLRGALEDIMEDDRRAGQVIQRMRTLLRKGKPEAATHDANQLVHDVMLLVKSDASLRGAEMRMELGRDLPRLWVDGVQIRQVLLNLLINALDALAERESGERCVVVCTRLAEEGIVEIAVEDSGKGIVEEELDRIFEAFYTTKSKGLGLGLSISRSIVEAHRGKLRASSEPGRGTRLSLTLPAWQGQL